MTTVSSLRAILSDLRDGKGKPSRAEVAESLTLCYDIVKQLRSMTDGGAGQRKATELTSACDSLTSGSDSEAGSSSAKARPSAKARARLRRQFQQQQWQEQPPLPGVFEQQEQHFRESLWAGQWVVAPVVASPPKQSQQRPPPPSQPEPPRARTTTAAERIARITHARDASAFREGMWTGGWQRVAIGEASAQPAAAAPVPEQEAELERMLTVPATRPHHERIPSEELMLAFGQQQWLMTAAAYTSTGGPVFRQRVLRCLKVRRWLRMQRVWTEWMRDEGEAPCCDLAPRCQGSCAKSTESQCESEASSEA